MIGIYWVLRTVMFQKKIPQISRKDRHSIRRCVLSSANFTDTSVAGRVAALVSACAGNDIECFWQVGVRNQLDAFPASRCAHYRADSWSVIQIWRRNFLGLLLVRWFHQSVFYGKKHFRFFSYAKYTQLTLVASQLLRSGNKYCSFFRNFKIFVETKHIYLL